MTYILDCDGDYTKQCETEGCPNVILLGVSTTKCIRCLEDEGVELVCKIIPYFEQRFML
jgi:hypothetical protein